MDSIVLDEIAKNNAVNTVSEFEEDVMEDIKAWANMSSLSFSSNNEMIDAYWATKLD
mgnify:CR=1 FL=1